MTWQEIGDNNRIGFMHRLEAPQSRITVEPGKRDGKPCIRGMRITVEDVLGWLSHGMTEGEIMEEHPGIEKDDFSAVYAFAAEMTTQHFGHS